MAAGPITTTGALADSLPTIHKSARVVREFEGVMVRLSDRKNMDKGTGTNWNEISLNQLTASAVTENTINENMQQLSDTLFSIKPTMVQIAMIITDKTRRNITPVVAAEIGVLGQNAMQRKKDQDGLTLIQSASSALGTTATPMSFAQVSSASALSTGNANEPSVTGIFTVLHPWGILDIQTELTSAVGTYAIPAGLTEETFRRGFEGTVSNSEVFRDGNIVADGTPDMIGGTFAREGVVLVDGQVKSPETRREPLIGGGSDLLVLNDEYGWGERSAGNWVHSHTHDATAPS